MNLDGSGKFDGVYHFPERNLNFDEISVVWNRRIHEPNIGSDLDKEPALKEWMIDESMGALNISFTLIKAPIFNPWEVNERLKFNKWIQMKRAAEFGLEIPSSCVTNNLKSIKDFWETIKHEMVFKKIRRGLFNMTNGKTLLVHTNLIPKEKFNEESLKRMRFCPMFLQKHIIKKHDIRSVVIGEKVFSIAIHSQNVLEGIIDYRKAAILGKLDQMKHEIIDLGDDINSKLISYTKSFELAFSVIDLIMTKDERIIFLEDNPNGQWAWLEHKTGVPISEAFADYFSYYVK